MRAVAELASKQANYTAHIYIQLFINLTHNYTKANHDQIWFYIIARLLTKFNGHMIKIPEYST